MGRKALQRGLGKPQQTKVKQGEVPGPASGSQQSHAAQQAGARVAGKPGGNGPVGAG